MLGFLLSRDGSGVLNVEIRDIGENDKLCAGFMNSYAVECTAEVFGEDAIGQIRATDSLSWIWRSYGREVVERGRCALISQEAADGSLRKVLPLG